jgi:hypothetical protein
MLPFDLKIKKRNWPIIVVIFIADTSSNYLWPNKTKTEAFKPQDQDETKTEKNHCLEASYTERIQENVQVPSAIKNR